MNVLRFTLSGKFGHFKRLEGSTVKQTHTIPPRTVIQGLFAGILGLERDSYYEDFENAKFAVVPKEIRRQTLPQLFASTKPDQLEPLTNSTKAPDYTEDRQRLAVEYLINPKYTIYADVPDKYKDELNTRLEEHRYEYTPCLGTSECLARIEHDGKVPLSKTASKKFDSAVPENQITTKELNQSLTFERFPTNFTTTETGRKPTGFINLIVPLENKQISGTLENGTTYTDGENTLVFF